MAIFFAAFVRRFRLACALSGLVLLECAVLFANHGRCPLTDIAGRYTQERVANFDIYLPLRLAQQNKAIFGALFVTAELALAGRWLGSRRRSASPENLNSDETGC
jgi:hypothetical protein